MTRVIGKDYIHTYQQTSFEDLGKDKHSPHGYSWKRGNVLLEGAKKDLLETVDVMKMNIAADFRNSIDAETPWKIFQHLNEPLKEAEETDPTGVYESLFGDMEIPPIVNFAINSALYTGKRSGFQGYWTGNSILLEELRNPNSIIYNINRPDFKKRIVNNALWEEIGSYSKSILETILSQEASLLDSSFADTGWKIFKMNNKDDVSLSLGFNFVQLSRGAMINFAYFVNELKNSKIPHERKNDFQKIFVQDYLGALNNRDQWNIPYFESREKEELKNLVK